MGALYPRGKIPFAETGDDEQGAEKLAAAVNIDGYVIFLKAAAMEGKGKVPFGAAFVITDLTAQLLQGIQQRRHGTSAHLLRGIHVVYAMGKAQIGCEKTGGSSGAAHILSGFSAGNPAAFSADPDGPALFVGEGSETQILNAFQEVSGIVGKKRSPQHGSSFCQGGKQQSPVCDAFGAGNRHCEGGAFRGD